MVEEPCPLDVGTSVLWLFIFLFKTTKMLKRIIIIKHYNIIKTNSINSELFVSEEN